MSHALSSDVGETAGPLVNMRELALKLRTSRQSISLWIDKWADFPIVQKGSNGREYQFDAAAVIAFLRSKKEEQARSTAVRDQELAQLALPFEADDAPQLGGLSTKDKIEALRLRRMQREDAEREGQLVDAASVSNMLSTAFIQFNRDLHTAIRQAGREQNLPDSAVRALDARVADAQRAFVRGMAAMLSQATPEGGPRDEP